MRPWLSAAGLHALLLLAATAVIFEQALPAEPGPVTIVLREERARVTDCGRLRDLFERRGIPTDDDMRVATEEPAIFFPETQVGDQGKDDVNLEVSKSASPSSLGIGGSSSGRERLTRAGGEGSGGRYGRSFG